jgi:hypothetical protein
LKIGFSTTLNVPPTFYAPFGGTIHQTNTGLVSNQIWIEFTDDFTPGILKVEPYCTCNTTTDYLYSKGAQVELVAAPLPAISISGDSTITCIVDILVLSIAGSAGTTKTWHAGSLPTYNDTLILTGSDAMNTYYYATVQETAGEQCRNKDSVFVSEQQIYPELQLAPISSPLVWNCYTQALGSLETILIDTNTSYPSEQALVYYNLDSVTTVYGDTIQLNSSLGETVFAVYPSLGCVTNFALDPFDDLDAPTVSLTILGNDTLNCFIDSTTLELNTPSQVSYSWINGGMSVLSQNVTVHASDSFIIAADTISSPIYPALLFYQVTDTLNGCVTNGQTGLYIDNRPLIPALFSDVNSYTCSQDSLLLIAPNTFGSYLEGWVLSLALVDSSFYFHNDEAIYAVQAPNGCWSYDTISVSQTSELELNVPENFNVCPDVNFTLNVSTIGSENYTYLWNNGNTVDSNAGVGGIDTLFIVNVENTSGTCFGIDTIEVTITDPISLTFSAFVDCNDGGYIQVVTISGGAVANNSQYVYNFDNDSLGFSSNTNWTVENFNSKSVLVRDTLGCVYEFATEIISVNEIPAPQFLVSTYNQIGDTIAMVNIADFSGFDSVVWSSDASVNLYMQNDSVALFSVLDTGWVSLYYTGFIFGDHTCEYTFKKSVYFSAFIIDFGPDTSYVGVSNLSISPNPSSVGSAITISFDLPINQYFTVIVTTSISQILPELSWVGEQTGPVSQTFTGLSLSAGTYYVHVLSEFGAQTKAFVIQ